MSRETFLAETSSPNATPSTAFVAPAKFRRLWLSLIRNLKPALKQILPRPIKWHLGAWRHGRLTLRRLSPLSRRFGYDRGTPIDRKYIESFLEKFRHDIRGRVLEIGDRSYTRQFGADRVTTSDVLHVEHGHEGVTIVADLSGPGVPHEVRFDCIIITQTLQLIFDLDTAVSNLYSMLAPGGVALVTVPSASPVVRDQGDPDCDCWRFTASGLRRLFARKFERCDLSVFSYGNVLTASAFLYGMSAEDLKPGQLDMHDPDIPVIVAIRAPKPDPRVE